MEKDDELELLKIELDNRIDGLLICKAFLTDEEKDLLKLLSKCRSVLNRVKPRGGKNG